MRKINLLFICLSLFILITSCSLGGTTITHTITFDTDGGTIIEPITLIVGTPINVPEEPVKDGYLFLDWDKQIPQVMPDYDLIVKATYAKITLDLEYNYDEKTNSYSVAKYNGTEENIVITKTYKEAFVTSIDKEAFKDNESIKSVIMPNTITKIEDEAFMMCNNLQSVTLSKNLEVIGNYAFYGCCFSDVLMPIGLTIINDYAFGSCHNLDSIIIPSTVTNLGIGTFSDCFNLTEITLSPVVEILEEMLFAECDKLKSVIIPEGIKTIDSNVFYECNNLEMIVLPSSVIEIKELAVNSCTNIKLIYIPRQVEIIRDSAFCNCPKLNIYCEIEEMPTSWEIDWNIDDVKVVWGYNIKENV